jgi:hypothetical protein
MKSNRYTRLLLVLIVPLLTAGFIAAEKQVFFELDTLTQCSKTKEEFSCYTTHTRRSDWLMRKETGGVWMWPNTYLTDGFYAPVITLGVIHTEFKNGVSRQTGTIGAGLKKTLQVGRSQGANFASPGYCTLSPHADPENSWSLSGESGISESFKFFEKTTDEKYQKLRASLKIINSENASEHKFLYASSVLIPLLSFLAASAIIFWAPRKTY